MKRLAVVLLLVGTLPISASVFVGPTQASPGTFSHVSVGEWHTCGVRTDGTLACWGDNGYGQATPPTGTFSQVSAGDYHNCGLRTDGTLACWGLNWGGQATPPTGTFTQVSAGNSHTCGVRTDGTLACWGWDYHEKATPPAGTFSQVSAGYLHTCGVRTDGTLACWGDNDYGQTSSLPTGTFTEVSAGAYHTCGLRTEGTLACWGLMNDYGQVTPPAGTFSQVSTGWYHNCGLRADGSLACWGRNNYGQATPPTGTFTEVSAGDLHTCGLRTDGTLACWGPVGRILVDSSRDGGLWWFPQSEGFDPYVPHQGWELADYLRGRGYVVDELPRPSVINVDLLASYDLVIRANECCGAAIYLDSEIAAYQEYVAEGGLLLLLSDSQAAGENDFLGGAFGLVFEGHSYGENRISQFAAHPIAEGVSSVVYGEGSGVREDSLPSSAEIIGWLSDETWLDMNGNGSLDPGEPSGSAALGVMTVGSGRIAFIGDVNGIEVVPQPFTSNLFDWLLRAPPVGGIAELPDIARAPAGEAAAAPEGSGRSAGSYAEAAGGLAAAIVAGTVGAWYARRRWLRHRA